MIFSAFTMVSRNDERMREATRSVMDQGPADYVCYIDTTRIKGEEYDEVKQYLEGQVGARVKDMELGHEDHYADVNAQVYLAILEARHPWVLDCDDDDRVLYDAINAMAPFAFPNVGAVYGHKLRHDRKDQPYMVNSWDVHSPFEVAGMRGSVILYNRDAMRKIFQNLDIFRGQIDESFGYFWEYKIAYWMTRAGYVLRTCHDMVMFQNTNLTRHDKMKSLKDAWYPMVVKNREPLELIINEARPVMKMGSDKIQRWL